MLTVNQCVVCDYSGWSSNLDAYGGPKKSCHQVQGVQQPFKFPSHDLIILVFRVEQPSCCIKQRTEQDDEDEVVMSKAHAPLRIIKSLRNSPHKTPKTLKVPSCLPIS